MTDHIEKRKINSWLENSEFLKNSGYPDTYYLESLCYHVSSYLKNIPVPILTTLDTKNYRIYFSIGPETKKHLTIDNQVNPYDAVTLIKGMLEEFYPSYSVVEERERELTEEEILYKVKHEKMDLNDAINYREIISVRENAIIEKVFFPKDEFILNVNGDRFVRSSVTLKSAYTVSSFLKHLRTIENDIERKQFIMSNSIQVRELLPHSEIIEINYQGMMMLNFFKINKKFIKSEPVKLEDYVYRWGNFKITFESHLLKSDCLSLFHKD